MSRKFRLGEEVAAYAAEGATAGATPPNDNVPTVSAAFVPEPDESATSLDRSEASERHEEQDAYLPSDTDADDAASSSRIQGVRVEQTPRPTQVFAADGINLFLSGGGIRSALGSLGVIARLIETQRWEFVTSVVSVSGGTFTNATLAALRGADPLEELRGLLGRLVRNPPPRRVKASFSAFAIVVALFGLTVHLGYELAHRPIDDWRLIIVLFAIGTIAGVLVLRNARSTVRAHAAQALLGFGCIVLIGYGFGRHSRLAGLLLGFVGLLTIATAIFFILGVMTFERVRFLLGTLPPWQEMQTDGRVHVFAVTDTANGTPVYVAVRDGVRRVFRSVSSRTQLRGAETHDLEELLGATISPDDTVTAAIALPGLEAPVKLETDDGTLLLSDGGLHGTLASRFDPTADRRAGLVTDELYSLVTAMGGTVGAQSIVVDGGQFLRKASWLRLTSRPVIGRVTDLFRALLISLDALITHDRAEIIRHLHEHKDARHWYLRVTGAGVPDTFTDHSGDLPEPLTTRMLELRSEADRVGLLSGFKSSGRACAKAGAFVTWMHECQDDLTAQTPDDARRQLDEFDRWFDLALPTQGKDRKRRISRVAVSKR